jgi:hypothetical protein
MEWQLSESQTDEVELVGHFLSKQYSVKLINKFPTLHNPNIHKTHGVEHN